MAFRLNQQVEDWFKHILKKDGPLQTKFDMYYLCLMLGMAIGKPGKLSDAPEFVNHFVGEYKAMQRVIIGLLLIVELQRLGTNLSDRRELQNLMGQYIDPSNPANLSDAGFARLNEYASGGFGYLAEQFPDKPHHIEDFLQFYIQKLQQAVAGNAAWKQIESL